jgi:hypothetical protein
MSSAWYLVQRSSYLPGELAAAYQDILNRSPTCSATTSCASGGLQLHEPRLRLVQEFLMSPYVSATFWMIHRTS